MTNDVNKIMSSDSSKWILKAVKKTQTHTGGGGKAPQSKEGANLFDRNPNLNSNPTSPKSTLHVRQQAQATTSH